MRVTYYLDVLSSWCFWAEPAWAELKRSYPDRVEFVWKLALLEPESFPKSRAQCDWFYRRSGTITGSPYALNSGWMETEPCSYLAPNLIAEAAKDLGAKDDLVRLVLAHSALREGRPLGRWEVSGSIAAAAAGLNADTLIQLARSPEIEARARACTAEFYAAGASQRPSFVLENKIGDRAMFSGLATAPPIIAAIEAMLADQNAYSAYTAHHGEQPPA